MGCNSSDGYYSEDMAGCAQTACKNGEGAAGGLQTRTRRVALDVDVDDLAAVADVSFVRRGLKLYDVANRTAVSVLYDVRLTCLTGGGAKKTHVLPLSALFFLPCDYNCDTLRYRISGTDVDVGPGYAAAGACGGPDCGCRRARAPFCRVRIRAAVTLAFGRLA